MDKKYTHGKLIGKGSFGSVYRVQKDDKIIAVKIVRINNDRMKVEAEKEVKFLETLSKCIPSVVCYYESYIKDKLLYIEMEYIQGNNLLAFSIKYQNNPKLNDFLLSIIGDLIPGLEYIHSKGIVHRDIKPDNIMISTVGNQPKLIDIGLACFYIRDLNCENTNNLCCFGKVGTPFFMAPETLLEGITYPESDIWSLAASIYFVATKTHVFEPVKQTVEAVLEKAKEPIKLKSTGNIKLDILLSKMLEKDVLKRINISEIKKNKIQGYIK